MKTLRFMGITTQNKALSCQYNFTDVAVVKSVKMRQRSQTGLEENSYLSWKTRIYFSKTTLPKTKSPMCLKLSGILSTANTDLNMLIISN